VLRRGVRTAVCRKTFELYSRPPYAASFEPKPPRNPVSAAEAVDFDCAAGTLRAPRVSKRAAAASADAGSCCAPGTCC
jgi:arsenite methyltransferase